MPSTASRAHWEKIVVTPLGQVPGTDPGADALPDSSPIERTSTRRSARRRGTALRHDVLDARAKRPPSSPAAAVLSMTQTRSGSGTLRPAKGYAWPWPGSSLPGHLEAGRNRRIQNRKRSSQALLLLPATTRQPSSSVSNALAGFLIRSRRPVGPVLNFDFDRQCGCAPPPPIHSAIASDSMMCSPGAASSALRNNLRAMAAALTGR